MVDYMASPRMIGIARTGSALDRRDAVDAWRSGLRGRQQSPTWTLSSLDFTLHDRRRRRHDADVRRSPAASRSGTAPDRPRARAVVYRRLRHGAVSVAVPGDCRSAKFGTPVRRAAHTVTTSTGTSVDRADHGLRPRRQRAPSGIAEQAPREAEARRSSTRSLVTAERGYVPVTGEVTVYDGDKAIATATLVAKDRGQDQGEAARRSPSGVHKLSVSYAGSDTVRPSVSPKIPVIVR